MSKEQSELINLELAWKRLKRDITNRSFIRNPFEVEIIDNARDKYLGALLNKVANGTYHPSPQYVCNVPKKGFLIRPGGHLNIDDRILYYAILGTILPEIYEKTQGNIDHSCQIDNDIDKIDWIINVFQGWSEFRINSLKKIDDGAKYVVIADITGYYENIDLSLLMSDIIQTGANKVLVDLLSECLNRWTQVNNRGIPQGYTPSDILGKLYLNTVDSNLSRLGFDHLRYVDDIRIFCEDERTAKNAIMKLSELLRRRGLNLQSAKTKIYSAKNAKNVIEGVQSILQPILRQYINDVKISLQLENPYLTVNEADQIIEDINDGGPPVEVIKDAFKQLFIIGNKEDFNKTLFRFLLNRLGVMKDKFGLEYCIDALIHHPEETEVILKYFKNIEVIQELEPQLVDFLISDQSIYPYQQYQILEWFNKNLTEVSEQLLTLARQNTFNRSNTKYVTSISRIMLGNFGSNADLERIEYAYSETDNIWEKCEIIYALKRMETSRRNSFYSRAKHDGEILKIATTLNRQN